jgi:hypothetical protein
MRDGPTTVGGVGPSARPRIDVPDLQGCSMRGESEPLELATVIGHATVAARVFERSAVELRTRAHELTDNADGRHEGPAHLCLTTARRLESSALAMRFELAGPAPERSAITRIAELATRATTLARADAAGQADPPTSAELATLTGRIERAVQALEPAHAPER